ncbi:MAG: aminotransferase class III-fold pyridoxal phosphate-dependent enzyme, partial [Anaerolineales bacterium]|nr:aminotransferase class III-fold pyridoxal phosphate-dependent enzyme [Anaerolineales bacterium]
MFDLSNDDILPLSKEHIFYTWSAQAKVNPIPVKKAKGVYFWDTEEKRYLDFNSMTMCVNIGHGDERIIKAMQEQAAELPYAAPGMTTKIRALAGKTLAGITPGQALTKVLFTLGGADANENAIKLARGYSGRHKILTRYRSYHGATAGAMAATGDPRRLAWEPNLMTGIVRFLDPYRYRSTFHRTNPELSEVEF